MSSSKISYHIISSKISVCLYHFSTLSQVQGLVDAKDRIKSLEDALDASESQVADLREKLEKAKGHAEKAEAQLAADVEAVNRIK